MDDLITKERKIEIIKSAVVFIYIVLPILSLIAILMRYIGYPLPIRPILIIVVFYVVVALLHHLFAIKGWLINFMYHVSPTIIPVIFITDLNPGSGFVFAQINLIWGEFPQDLDAHLWTPTIEGFSYHVYFGNPGDLSGVPYAAYDMDADAGWGPERIVIGQAFPGTYYFSVQQYAGESSIPLSGALVSLIKPDRTAAEFSPPDSAGTGEGWYWHVCSIDGATGEITEINTMTQSPPVTTGVIEQLPAKAY